MPYSQQHTRNTRRKIVAAATKAFNHKGFLAVSIDDVMAEAGLTRGGFYNHFANKEALLVAVLESAGQCSPLRQPEPEDDAGVDPTTRSERTIDDYLAAAHLDNVAAHCPLVALPADVAHGSDDLKARYRDLVEAMVEVHTRGNGGDRPRALAATALCVGAMLIARTAGDDAMANELLTAARSHAQGLQAAGSRSAHRDASAA